MQAYVSAAGKISRLAIGTCVGVRRQAIYDVPSDTAQNYHVAGLPFANPWRHADQAPNFRPTEEYVFSG